MPRQRKKNVYVNSDVFTYLLTNYRRPMNMTVAAAAPTINNNKNQTKISSYNFRTKKQNKTQSIVAIACNSLCKFSHYSPFTTFFLPCGNHLATRCALRAYDKIYLRRSLARIGVCQFFSFFSEF